MAKGRAFVFMGVTGSGKTTIGSLLAEQLHAPFADADDFHPKANKNKMAAGIPLTDEDRAPWLAALHGVLQGWVDGGTTGVMACSALKENYRLTLTDGIKDQVAFVWLDAPKSTLQDRLAHRHHEFMNPALLDSQLATLEPPSDAVRIANDRTPDQVVATVIEALQLGKASTGGIHFHPNA